MSLYERRERRKSGGGACLFYQCFSANLRSGMNQRGIHGRLGPDGRWRDSGQDGKCRCMVVGVVQGEEGEAGEGGGRFMSADGTDLDNIWSSLFRWFGTDRIRNNYHLVFMCLSLSLSFSISPVCVPVRNRFQ